MKPSLREGEKEPGCPPAGPVLWTATLRSGVTSSRTSKRKKEFKQARWFDARDEAMRFFGVEAGELEVVLKEHGK